MTTHFLFLNRLPPHLKNTLMYGISIVFMKGLSLILLPFLTHNLSQEQYGELEILTTFATIGSVFAGLGLAETLFRYCGMASSKEIKLTHANNLLSLSLFLAFIFALFSFFFASPIALLIPGSPSVMAVHIVLLTISLEALISVSLGWLRMIEQVKKFCLLMCGRALTQIVLTFYFIAEGMGVTGLLIACLLSALLQAICLLILIKRYLSFNLFSLKIKSYFIYSLPIMLSGALGFCLFGIDKWFLAEYASLEQVAIFAVAGKFALVVVILLQPFSMWWSPHRFQVLKQQGNNTLLFYTQLGLVLLLNVAIFIAGISPFIVDELVPKSYQGALLIIAPLILTMVAKEAVELVNIGCFIGKTSNSQLIINIICAILICILLVIFTPKHGMQGVAWCLFIGQLSRLVIFFSVSQYYLPLKYKKLSLLILSSLVVSFVMFSPLHMPPQMALIFTFIALIAFNLCVITLLFRTRVVIWLKNHEAINNFFA